MSTETLIYIILAGIGALLLSLFQYWYKTNRGKLHAALAFLRFLTYFLILLLLINPKFERIQIYEEKPDLVIAIDNSESIRHLDQLENSRSALELLRSNSELNERFNLNFFSFGNEIKPLDSLDFTEGQSNLNNIFSELDQVYRNRTAPLVMITDGNQTLGTDYEYGSKAYKQPVYPLILGDTISYSDLKISQLNVNKYAFLKNDFPVEVFISYSGTNSVSSNLVVYSGGRTLYSRDVSLNPEKRSERISFKLNAGSVGVTTYTARITPLETEKNQVNNSQPFAVEVIDQKTNIAIVSRMSHPDLGALKKSIESNEQRTVEILSPSDYMRDPDNYQLAILYQPGPAFNEVFDYLNNNSLNYFLIGGTNTSWATVNDNFANYDQEITNQTEDIQPDLNANFGAFIVEDLDFGNYPPLRSEFGAIEINVPYETILYKSIGATVIDEPLLFTIEQNNRREAVLLGEDLWKWRAQSYLNNQTFQDFDTFMGKLIQFLSNRERRSRLNLNYESFYNGNSDIIITSQFFNRNYEFDNKAKLELVLRNKNSEETTRLPFVIKQNSYQIDLSGMAAGDYSFTVSANNGEVSRSGSFTILDYNVEQQFLNANAAKLRSVAGASDGLAVFSGEESRLIQSLMGDERFNTIQKSIKKVVPLIDYKILLMLLALTLAAEWFTRKYNGLI